MTTDPSCLIHIKSYPDGSATVWTGDLADYARIMKDGSVRIGSQHPQPGQAHPLIFQSGAKGLATGFNVESGARFVVHTAPRILAAARKAGLPVYPAQALHNGRKP